jgi:hypothetical protein
MMTGASAHHHGSRATLAVWARNCHHIAVEIAKPDLSVAWSRIDVEFLYDLSAQGASLVDDCIKVVHLEPEYDAVPERPWVRIDEVGVIVLVPGMELKNQATSTDHPIIYIAMAVLW